MEHFRVFIATPGDLDQERRVLFETLARLPYDPLLRGKVTIEVVAWDGPFSYTPLLASVDPQSAIEAGLPTPGECDIVVVGFHGRIGSLLPARFAAEFSLAQITGTVWEYRDALRAHEARGRPEVLVYRKTTPPTMSVADPKLADAVSQFQGVQDFFEQMRSELRGYNSYSSLEEFAGLIEGHLRDLLARFLREASPAAFLEWAHAPSLPLPRWFRDFVQDETHDPFQRGLVLDGATKLLREGSGPVAEFAPDLLEIARTASGSRSASAGRAGVRLMVALVEAGIAHVEDLKSAGGSSSWEVRALAVKAASKYTLIDGVLCVYESMGSRFSYWQPVQTMRDHVIALSTTMDDTQLARAITLVEQISAHPDLSAQQQRRSGAALKSLSELLERGPSEPPKV